MFSDRPRDQLSSPISEAAAEEVRASLHHDDSEILWLRVEHDGGVFFVQLGPASLVVGRTRERGPFFLTGSFARQPGRARRVVVEYDEGTHEPETADAGWLWLAPSTLSGPVKVRWLDDRDRQHQAIEYDSLDDVGILGPTYYGPPREPTATTGTVDGR